ncbi:MAG: phosphatidylglycerophosphatase A [Elusimicrobiota bacterium]|nr:phosphatidylglycerophosphatase A [Elusimicrobiota bacterium]
MNNFPRNSSKIFVLLFATGFGIGLIPYFPGTSATLLSAVLYWFFIPEDLFISGIIIFIAVGISIYISGMAEKIYNKKDDRRIVIDEIVGYWITMYSIPKKLYFVLFGFVLFRLFDILKLPPMKKVQKLFSGFGIVLDDLLAGILGNVLLRIIIVYFPRLN